MNGRRLKKILATKAAYAILDSTDAKGGTWLAGGCGLLADALAEYCPSGEVWAVWNRRNQRVEHFVYNKGNMFYDGDGAATGEGVLRKMRELEHVRDPITLRPPHPDLYSGHFSNVVHDPDASSKLAALFRKKGLGC
jgi:hypothetical protein